MLFSVLLVLAFNQNVVSGSWRQGKLNVDELRNIKIDTVPNRIIYKTMKDYIDNPIHEGYTSLKIYASYINDQNNEYTLIFYIDHVEDVMVVYVVDVGENIVDKFFISEWS